MPRLNYEKKTDGNLNLVSKVYQTDSIFGKKEMNDMFLQLKANVCDLNEKYFSDAEYITVSKVVRTIEERPDGETFTTYDEYLVSDIDLVVGNDFTED